MQEKVFKCTWILNPDYSSGEGGAGETEPSTPRLPCFPWWFPPLCHFIRTMQCRKIFLSFSHSHPRGPQSFWATPGIKTSGHSQLLSMYRVLTLCFSANHIRQISHFESVNQRLLVLEAARGLDSLCRPKGSGDKNEFFSVPTILVLLLPTCDQVFFF